MGGGCQICSYHRSHKALELHHLDSSTKERSFGDLMRVPSKIANWFDEFRKCILLCANCHREVHDGLTEVPSNYKVFDQKQFESMRDWAYINSRIEENDILLQKYNSLTEPFGGWGDPTQLIQARLKSISEFFDNIENGNL